MERKTKVFLLGLLLLLPLFVFMLQIPNVYAAGWMEEAAEELSTEYAKFPIARYELDMYIDTTGDWLPWNWGDGVVNNVYSSFFMVMNGVWQLNIWICYFVGFVVEQAYNLDFITAMTEGLSSNIQNLLGVTSIGLKSTGLLPSFLPILIIVTGGYMVYTGMIKRQATKAFSHVLAFIVILMLGMGFVGYSKSYINMINNFQKELNTEVLSIGNAIMTGKSNGGEEAIHSIRDNLFMIQIKNPWLLLQYGDSDIDTVGEDRVNGLLSLEPGEEREDVAKQEVEGGNENMTAGKLPSRLAMVGLIFFANFIISICVFIFCILMIVSQIMFVLYASFFPAVFVFGLLPGGFGRIKNIIEKTANAIFQKAGITIILTVVFCISMAAYNLTESTNFFWIVFLQIAIFVASVFKTGELLGLLGIGKESGRGAARAFHAVEYFFLRKLLKSKVKAKESGKIPRDKPEVYPYHNWGWSSSRSSGLKPEPRPDRLHVDGSGIGGLIEQKDIKKSDTVQKETRQEQKKARKPEQFSKDKNIGDTGQRKTELSKDKNIRDTGQRKTELSKDKNIGNTRPNKAEPEKKEHRQGVGKEKVPETSGMENQASSDKKRLSNRQQMKERRNEERLKKTRGELPERNSPEKENEKRPGVISSASERNSEHTERRRSISSTSIKRYEVKRERHESGEQL